MIGQIALSIMLAVDWQAEFCGRSVPFRGTTYYAERYLVVEVTVKPERAKPVDLAAGQFRLRVVAGKKKPEVLRAASAGMVAASFKYADWGRGRMVEGFPGDPRVRRVPDVRNPNAPEIVDEENPKVAAEVVVKAALGEGPTLGETKGLLYFEWPGKLKEIRKLELVWDTLQGEQVIQLLSR